MSSARWAVGVALMLGCLPVAILQACGGSGGASASHGGDGGSDDGTIDGSGSDGGDGSADGGRTGDGAFGGEAGPCVPGCPASVTCGRYTDCAGNVLTCGMPCASGKSCITSGTSQSCQTPSCTGKCGEIAVDSCGVAVNCGGCPTGQTCVDNACVTQAPPGDAGKSGGCGKLTCSPAAGVNLCGTVSDGCGNTQQCTCPSGKDCTGGICTAPPPECTEKDGGVGSKCGTVTNACGSGQVQCAGCTGNSKCDNGTCTACTPPSCGAMSCGKMDNGCGPAVSCGNCSGGEQCYNNTCCTPKTCAEAQDAGTVTGCDPVDLGCGVQQTCSGCAAGQICRSNACCTPQTCAEAMDAGTVTGCDPVDLGCGVQQTCAACAAGQICRSNACCTPQTCRRGDGRRLCHGLRSRRSRVRRSTVVRPLRKRRDLPGQQVRRLHAEDLLRLRQCRLRPQRRVRQDPRLLCQRNGLHVGRAVLPAGRRGLPGIVLPAAVRSQPACGTAGKLRDHHLLRRGGVPVSRRCLPRALAPGLRPEQDRRRSCRRTTSSSPTLSACRACRSDRGTSTCTRTRAPRTTRCRPLTVRSSATSSTPTTRGRALPGRSPSPW